MIPSLPLPVLTHKRLGRSVEVSTIRVSGWDQGRLE